MSSVPTASTRRYRLSGPTSKDLLAPDASSTDASEELVRLQSLLAQWLRMENVLVLLAAGASVGRGGKTLPNLERSVLQLLLAYYSDKANSELAAFIAARQGEVATGGAPGFEEWLSQLVTAHALLSNAKSIATSITWRSGPTPSISNLQLLIDDLRRTIFLFCALPLPAPTTTPTAHHAFVTKLLARDPSLGRTRIFTLNYDTLIEQALDHLGIHYWDGFVGKAQPKFDPSCYSLDIYFPGDIGEGKVRRYDKFLHLFKLHGSIHWWERASSPGIFAAHPDLAKYQTFRDSFSKTSKVSAVEFDTLSSTLPGTLGILPTASKYIETLDLPYAHLFRIFHQSLQLPQSFLLISGYGFGDNHVTRIVEDALINPSFVMLVVEPAPNPNLRSRLEGYQAIGARVYLLEGFDTPMSIGPTTPATFDDLATNVLPNVAWLEEWVRVRKIADGLRGVP